MTVASVLRSGGWCTPADVQRLAAGLHQHLTLPHRFVCLSDMAVDGVECWRLPATAQPGFWSKLELFRRGLFHGPTVYFDLDTLLVGNIDALGCYAGPFAMIDDFFKPELAQSGVMAWDADGDWPRVIDAAWQLDPGAVMTRFPGDGEFIAHVLGGKEDRLQALYPGQIVSYKVHCRTGVPDGARVVCLHGRPRPSEVTL